MKYNIRLIGNKMCYINCAYLHNLDDFIQTLKDVDKQLTQRTDKGYNNE